MASELRCPCFPPARTIAVDEGSLVQRRKPQHSGPSFRAPQTHFPPRQPKSDPFPPLFSPKRATAMAHNSAFAEF